MKLSAIPNRIQAAAKALIGEPLLSAVPMWALAAYASADKVINAKGIAAYQEIAFTDAEAASCLWTAICRAVPGVSVNPAGDSPEAVRNAALVTAVLDQMDGSTLDTVHDGLMNGIITGFSVSEPMYKLITIPGMGQAVGLQSLDVRPSESFSYGGIVTDQWGRIVSFKQDAFHGAGTVSIEQVVYWAHMGSANNRYGQSILRPVYEPWKVKLNIRRIYQYFMATNASGFRIGTMPDTEYNIVDKRSQFLSNLERMGSITSLVKAKSHEVEFSMPQSGTGGHFREMIDECNSEIRRGILGDSAYSAQEDGGGSSFASRAVSQENVRDRFAVMGRSYTESLTEQLCPMILKLNGYSGPVPHIVPLAPLNSEESRAQAMAVLSEAKTAGLLTQTLPAPAQLALFQQFMRPLGVEITTLDTPEATPPLALAAPKLRTSIRAAEGKREKQGRAQAAALSAEIDKRAADLGAVWAQVYPAVLDQITKALFQNTQGGGWKTTDLTEMRKAIQDNIRYKSSELKNSIVAALEASYKMGGTSADASLPIKATSPVSTRRIIGWNPTQARSIMQNRVQMLLEDKYTSIASKLYYLVENAFTGSLPPYVTENKLRELLSEAEFNANHAGTIIDTACASAWNAARAHAYAEFENPGGTGVTDIIGYEFLAVEDEHTTEGCLDLNGEIFAVDDPNIPRPPLHYNCRSMLLPVYGSERDAVTIADKADTAEQVAYLKRIGEIQEGFGGV